MATPYDGKIGFWHWTGESIGETSIDALAQTIRKWCPNGDAIYVKTSDGIYWQGRWDDSGMAVKGKADVKRWVDTLANYGLEFHSWVVVKGVNLAGEIDVISQVGEVPGVKSIILDVEPYDYFWEGPEAAVHTLMQGIRKRLGNNFHIGLSVDPRRNHFSSIYPYAWQSYVDSVLPQVYWDTMQRTPSDILQETYLVWGTYGKPIYPVLQGSSSSALLREAQRLSRSRHGALGLSYWRTGVVSTGQFPAINDEKVTSELGPDNVTRTYDWEKIIAKGDEGYQDGNHTGAQDSQIFTTLTGVRGSQFRYKATEKTNDKVWALWNPKLPVKGRYEVSVYVPAHHATTHQAQYHIHGIQDIGSELLVKLNQLNHSNRWVPLVVWDFVEGGGQVNLTDLTGESTTREIAFDAVRWRRVVKEEYPTADVGFDSPVGTLEERLTNQVWPGNWYDANGFGNYYTTVGAAYHTGSDLNLNKPSYDSDRNAPIYAICGGFVTYSGLQSGTWGHLIIIRHDPLPDGTIVWSRSAHVHNPIVYTGDRVERGQQLATIGNANGKLAAYHLHFDIAVTDILEQKPGHWPAMDWNAVIDNYVDPREFIESHRPARR